MTNNHLRIGILALTLLMFIGCAKVYYPEKSKILISEHKTLAVLPINFDLKTELNNQQPHMDSYPVDQYFGLAFREKLVKKLKSESLSVEIIDLKTIDNYFAKKIEDGEKDFSINQIPTIAKDLNADAVFVYCVRTASAKSQAGELAKDFAMALTTGFYSTDPTSEVKIINQIYDGQTGKLIWQFNHWNQGMYFTTPMLITNPIIKEVKNRIPYRIK